MIEPSTDTMMTSGFSIIHIWINLAIIIENERKLNIVNVPLSSNIGKNFLVHLERDLLSLYHLSRRYIAPASHIGGNSEYKIPHMTSTIMIHPGRPLSVSHCIYQNTSLLSIIWALFAKEISL